MAQGLRCSTHLLQHPQARTSPTHHWLQADPQRCSPAAALIFPTHRWPKTQSGAANSAAMGSTRCTCTCRWERGVGGGGGERVAVSAQVVAAGVGWWAGRQRTDKKSGRQLQTMAHRAVGGQAHQVPPPIWRVCMCVCVCLRVAVYLCVCGGGRGRDIETCSCCSCRAEAGNHPARVPQQSPPAAEAAAPAVPAPTADEVEHRGCSNRHAAKVTPSAQKHLHWQTLHPPLMKYSVPSGPHWGSTTDSPLPPATCGA